MTKKAVLPIVIVLILGLGGFFWWWNNREIKGSPDDYLIVETREGTFVKNEKAGLTVKVPEGWGVKKVRTGEGSIVIQTSEVDGKKNNDEEIVPPLTKGCVGEVSVVYKKMDFQEIKDEILSIHWGLKIKSEEFEEMIINNISALKNTFDSEVLGPAVCVYVPKKGKLYDFDLYWAPEEKEQCLQEFNNFLETISIN